MATSVRNDLLEAYNKIEPLDNIRRATSANKALSLWYSIRLVSAIYKKTLV